MEPTDKADTHLGGDMLVSPHKRSPVALGRESARPHLPHEREGRTLCHLRCAPHVANDSPPCQLLSQSLRAAAVLREGPVQPPCQPCGGRCCELPALTGGSVNVGAWLPGVFHTQFWVSAASRTGRVPTAPRYAGAGLCFLPEPS